MSSMLAPGGPAQVLAAADSWPPTTQWPADGPRPGVQQQASAADACDPSGRVGRQRRPGLAALGPAQRRDLRLGTAGRQEALERRSPSRSSTCRACTTSCVRDYPVVPQPTPEAPTKPEEAVFKLNWLSATGTGILVAAVLAGLLMGFSPLQMLRTYGETLVRVRFSLLTIAAMLALGYVTKYSGTDATLGLALAKTGVLYPFFGTLLGWLGVALTGSDTASNVLFGSLQKITADQVGISPTLMAAANSTGGVMGKMVDAQSIVVASTATNWYGHEGQHPALRVLPQPGAGRAGRHPGHAAGVRVSVHRDGGTLR